MTLSYSRIIKCTATLNVIRASLHAYTLSNTANINSPERRYGYLPMILRSINSISKVLLNFPSWYFFAVGSLIYT